MRIGDKVCHVTGYFAKQYQVGYFTKHAISVEGGQGIVTASFWLWRKVFFHTTGGDMAELWYRRSVLLNPEEYKARAEVSA